LGDITKETNKYYYQLDRLNGRKIVVLGNHDLPKHTKDLLDYVESVSGAVDYKKCLLTHVPIHPNEISFYKANIHAHIHHKNELDNLLCVSRYGDESNIKEDTYHKYINVDAYLLDFKPKTLKELGIT
jgi:calcineurin-like phosphoesterase family protein